MQQILKDIHWLIPWPLLLIGLIAIMRFVRGHLDELPFTESDRRLVFFYRRLIEVQSAVGLVFFVWSGLSGDGFPMNRILHFVAMFLSALAPFVADRLDFLEQASPHLRNFYSLLASFLLMLVGLSFISM